jgi:hypothetical protein
VIKTLLVDGDNLFKIGFHGVKEMYDGGDHLGGIYHFINILRKFLEEHNQATFGLLREKIMHLVMRILRRMHLSKLHVTCFI